jgi:hypothetical protein
MWLGLGCLAMGSVIISGVGGTCTDLGFAVSSEVGGVASGGGLEFGGWLVFGTLVALLGSSVRQAGGHGRFGLSGVGSMNAPFWLRCSSASCLGWGVSSVSSVAVST